MLPRRTAVLVNTDFESRSGEEGTGRAFEADAAVLETARAVEAALRTLGVEVALLPIASSLRGLIGALRESEIDTVFNLVESIANDYGREWQVPALLERHGIRYTGNGPLPLRVCRTKDRARRLLEQAGVRVATGITVASARSLTALRLRAIPFPCFVKPARVDGSIGIDASSICRDADALRRRVDKLAATLPGPYLVEQYLPGKEINVALFPSAERGFVVATEIDFSAVPAELPRIVTYDCKWNPNSPEYAAKSVPATLSPELAEEVERLARTAFRALGGRGYGRVDMRLDERGTPAVIDVNPNNDLHPDAGLAAAARSVGLPYEALIGGILESAGGGDA